jgi:lipoprotein-anchoring transpeptidase ErfK/SrfK
MRNLRIKYLLVSIEISFIVIIFILFTEFFETHFYPGTSINGVNVSCKTTEAADKRLRNWASYYVLELNERGDIKEWILGSEIGLNFHIKSSIHKREQNKTPWFLSYLNKSAIHISRAFMFDENLLENRVNELDCLDHTKVTQPKNASLLYSNGSYKIIKEVYGNKINESMLYYKIKGAVLNGTAELDLEKQKCYENPKIRSDSQKIKNTKAVAESYLASKIIYSYQGGSEVVDEKEISNWIDFDNDLTIMFNIKRIKVYLNTLATHYDTYGKIRDFSTSSGTMIKVGGGDYGWRVDIEGETLALIQAVLSGKTINREPKYSQKGAAPSLNDIGLTYVEIDLSKQHLWFYKNGLLIAQGSVVTGNVKNGYETPEGIYSLKYRIRNSVLKGENYQAKVSYWMPFNGDIGIHDATWRSRFGGNIYLTRGSHGCINAPYKLAEALFNNITVGTPIVCYY